MSTYCTGSNLANVQATIPANYRHQKNSVNNVQDLFKNHIIAQIMSECV